MLSCLCESFSYEHIVQLVNFLDSRRIFSVEETPFSPYKNRHYKMKLWNDKAVR